MEEEYGMRKDLSAEGLREVVEESVLFGGLALQAGDMLLTFLQSLLTLQSQLYEFLLADCDNIPVSTSSPKVENHILEISILFVKKDIRWCKGTLSRWGYLPNHISWTRSHDSFPSIVFVFLQVSLCILVSKL